MLLGGEAYMKMADALAQARVEDFVRYVSRRMREDPSTEHLSFKQGWYVMLGGYAELATKEYDG